MKVSDTLYLLSKGPGNGKGKYVKLAYRVTMRNFDRLIWNNEGFHFYSFLTDIRWDSAHGFLRLNPVRSKCNMHIGTCPKLNNANYPIYY
jgi:hypothetical protein